MEKTDNSLTGKKVKFIYDDGHQQPVPKKGIVENSDDFFFYIKNENGILEGLSKSRIIRLEVQDEN